MRRDKTKKTAPGARPTAAPGNTTAGTALATLEVDQSAKTVPAAKAKTKKLSSIALTSPKIGEVIQGLDDIGKKVYAKLVECAPDLDQQLKRLAKADDAQLKAQLDEYKEEDRKLGQGITTILKKRRELFRANVGLFWTIKECVVCPGFRSDLNGGNVRTTDYNLKMWGASTWQELVERYSPYGLDATDKYVEAFGEERSAELEEGTTGVTKPVARKQNNKGGNAGPKKKRRPTVAELANAKLAGEFKTMCNLALNSCATDEQIAATWKSKAQETYKSLTLAESNALKMPKILEAKQSEIEALGITLAKQVWASTLLPADSKEKQAAHKVLLKAGIVATIAPAPTQPQADPKLGPALNDQDAERVMVLVAQGKSVEPEPLAKYETWLALKGETERATDLRRELRVWKDAISKKSQKSSAPVPNGSPAETSTEPVAGASLDSNSDFLVKLEAITASDPGIKQEVQHLS